jgi:hypothetical protein
MSSGKINKSMTNGQFESVNFQYREPTPIISDFFGSAIASTASVGVPPTEFCAHNRPTVLVSS